MITCPVCGSNLDDEGHSLPAENESWCNTCMDFRPIEGGICARCGNDPDDDDEDGDL